jgi:hypothetical protein
VAIFGLENAIKKLLSEKHLTVGKKQLVLNLFCMHIYIINSCFVHQKAATEDLYWENNQ